MTDNVDEIKSQISQLPKFEGIKIPVDEKAVRTFQDYNAAVITTFEEYHAANIRLNDVNIYDALSRVALHLFGRQFDNECIACQYKDKSADDTHEDEILQEAKISQILRR